MADATTNIVSAMFIMTLRDEIEKRGDEPFRDVANDMIARWQREAAKPEVRVFHRVVAATGEVLRDWTCLYSDKPEAVKKFIKNYHRQHRSYRVEFGKADFIDDQYNDVSNNFERLAYRDYTGKHYN